jgi:hypothetical protein
MTEELPGLLRLLILAIPVAWLAWTVTHEEVFREFREFCQDRSEHAGSLLVRKFYLLFTCEYCLSHWCALAFELLFGFRLIFEDWRGYLVAFACLVWTANVYMNLYLRIRVDIRNERAQADHAEQKTDARHAA